MSDARTAGRRGRGAARLLCLSLLTVGLAAPAGARPAPAAPEVEDACGIEASAAETPPSAHPDYQDVCSAWFSDPGSTEDVPALRVTARFAGRLDVRTPSKYSVAWEVGDCSYTVTAYDTPVTRVDGVTELRTRSLGVGCGDLVPSPGCVPGCVKRAYTRQYDLPPDAVVVDGTDLVVTLVLDGDMAERAADVSAGRRLRGLSVEAGTTAAFYGPGGRFCTPDGCFATFSDQAGPGRDHVVPAPRAASPLNVRGCVSGTPAQASASRAHVADPAGDHLSRPVGVVPSGAFDLRAAWVAEAPSGLVLNIQASGAGGSADRTAYLATYGADSYVRADRRTDGTTAFTYGRVTSVDNDGQPRTRELGRTTGSFGPGGLVTVALPASTLPAAGAAALPLGRVFAHSGVTVSAAAGDVPLFAADSAGSVVDSTEPAQTCTVVLRAA